MYVTTLFYIILLKIPSPVVRYRFSCITKHTRERSNYTFQEIDIPSKVNTDLPEFCRYNKKICFLTRYDVSVFNLEGLNTVSML